MIYATRTVSNKKNAQPLKKYVKTVLARLVSNDKRAGGTVLNRKVNKVLLINKENQEIT